MPVDDRGVAGPSREGWALWLACALEMRFYEEQVENRPDTSPFFRRWRELASLKCDAFSEKREYANAITARNEEKEKPPFDLGMRQDRVILASNNQYDQWVSVHRAIRLPEVAGLPPSANHMSVAAGILKLAAEKLSTSDPEMAVRLVLRTVDYDQDALLMRVLSRPRVAALPADSARTLAQICSGVIEYALPRSYWCRCTCARRILD